MKVTLYKKCILNNSYNEVIDNNSKYENESVLGTALEHYLNSLEKISFDLNMSYATLSGSLTFPLGYDDSFINYNSSSFYEYNYMKIEEEFTETDKLIRYMFIDNIDIIDGFAVVKFSEDIWSNYGNKIKFRSGILSRSKALRYASKNDSYEIPFYNLPLNYKSNNKPVFKRLYPEDGSSLDDGDFYVVVLMQLYNTKESGEVTDRICVSGIISNDDISSTYVSSFRINNIDRVIELITKSSGNQFTTYVGSKKYNYEITKVMLVPYLFKKIFKQVNTDNERPIGTFDYKPLNQKYSLYNAQSLYGTNNLITPLAELDTHIVNGKDFKTLGVGLRNNIEMVELNGTDIPVTPVISITDTTLNIYLKLQNKFIDITSDLIMDIPISVQTKEVTQLKELNRTFENKMLDLSNINHGLDIGGNLVSGAVSGLSYGVDVASYASGIEGNIDSSNGVSAIGSATQIGKGITGIVANEEKRNVINAKLYTSNKALYINTRDSLLNASNGLVIMQIEPDNEIEVEQYIEESGYVVNEFLNKDLLNEYKPTRLASNVIKFDYIRLYGAFPQNIKDKLESILLNGFKIWLVGAVYVQ